MRHCYALLRGPLRRAAKDRVIDHPCIDIVLPKLPDMRKTFDDVVTAEEVDRLVRIRGVISRSNIALKGTQGSPSSMALSVEPVSS